VETHALPVKIVSLPIDEFDAHVYIFSIENIFNTEVHRQLSKNTILKVALNLIL
jgi:hypothetical protein